MTFRRLMLIVHERMPRVQYQFRMDRHPYFSCFRIYDFAPWMRSCAFDWTKTRRGSRIRLWSWTVYSSGNGAVG